MSANAGSAAPEPRAQYATIEDPQTIDCGKHALIEASAGTGKTYTIEHLVVRLIRDQGIPIDRVLVVTFTEKATGELKERIRKKLTDELRGHDAADTALARRLQAAVDGFDTAAIHTIHGFCHLVLTRYGFELGRPLATEVVDDRPLLQLLLRQRMRRVWPAAFQTDLLALLEISGYPEYDAHNRESRWERRVLRVILASAGTPLTIPSAPATPRELLEQIQTVRATTEKIFAKLRELVGPIDSEQPENSSFALRFSELNQRGPSRDRKLRVFIAPLLRLLNDSLHDTLDENGVPLSAAAGYIRDAYREKLDPELGFRTLTEEHWLKAGENTNAVCPELPAVVDALEELRALDFPRLAQLLAADTIAAVARDLTQYKATRGFVSFHDMLQLVNDALGDGDGALAQILLEQYPFAIVDEFQDTDPVQWEIFRKLYLSKAGRGVLCLVGDPKQAIYGFRGADVFTYFNARAELERLTRTGHANLYRLSTNYRSMPELVRAFNALFATTAYFGTAGESANVDSIYYTAALESPPDKRKIQVAGDSCGRGALHLIRLDAELSGTEAKRLYFRFLAREIHALIRSGTIRTGVAGGADRSLDFGDVCILLRTRTDAPLIEDALDNWNVPHSFYKKTGLYQTIEALELAFVLRAVAAPSVLEAGYKAFLTRFFRYTPEAIDDLRMRDLSPNAVEEPPGRRQLGRWHALARRRNWPAFFRSILQDSEALLPGSRDTADDPDIFDPRYERTITNYEQICDELSEHAVRENLDLTGIIEHLELLRGENIPVREEWDVHRQESEEPRVKLMTIHTAKGLEFPVVCIAGGFTRRPAHLYETYEFHNEHGERVHDLVRSAENEERFRAEEEAEERRLYYVALTRAAMKLYVPYLSAGEKGARSSAGPLGRFVREAIDAAFGSDQSADRAVQYLELDAAGNFFDGPPAASKGSRKTDREDAGAKITGGVSGATIDQIETALEQKFTDATLFPSGPRFVARRRRDLLSYTALSHGVGDARAPGDVAENLADEFIETSRDRNDRDATLPGLETPELAETPVALSPALRELDRRMRGPDAGTMLHDILEQLDYRNVGGDARELELNDPNRRLIARLLRRAGLLSAAVPDSASPDLIAEQQQRETEAVDFVGQLMRRVLTTPLMDGAANGLTLQELAPENRIHEMEFYFYVPELRALFEGAPAAAHDAEMRYQDGHVWGFIDLVFRHAGRYYLADWKSNVLTDYGPAGLARAMDSHQYHLQYQIYTYALWRWLEQNVADFDYERDFGGVFYFFLRGMNPDRPGEGVYFARPTPAENAAVLQEVRDRVVR